MDCKEKIEKADITDFVKKVLIRAEANFRDIGHFARFCDLTERTAYPDSSYCVAMMYLLSLKDDVYAAADNLFDFSDTTAKLGEERKICLSNDGRKIVALAFNLWNGYTAYAGATPAEIFNSDYMNEMLTAVRICFINR